MKPRVYICGNGILTNPGNVNDWNRRAAIWIDAHTPHKAEAYLYFQDILFRRLFQDRRVNEVIDIIKDFTEGGFEIVLVGHSNFCDIICRVLQKYSGPIAEIHLVAAACDRDFSKNGINRALYDGRLGFAVVYASRNDSALRKAHWSQSLLGWAGLGYGDLGMEGPLNAPTMVNVIWDNACDHSTWWDSEHFEKTMRLITCSPK